MHDSSGDADAWLISPGLYLEEGKSYEITYTYKRFPGSKVEGTQEPLLLTEKFEVGIGDEKTTENLQTYILNTYEVDNDEYETGKSSVSVEKSGTYYIGIHLISEKVLQNGGSGYLCLGNLSIKEQIIVNPNPVASLSVTPDPDKKLSAHLSWENPTQWSNGENIHENVDAEIYRNEELIKTLTNIASGTVS